MTDIDQDRASDDGMPCAPEKLPVGLKLVRIGQRWAICRASCDFGMHTPPNGVWVTDHNNAWFCAIGEEDQVATLPDDQLYGTIWSAFIDLAGPSARHFQMALESAVSKVFGLPLPTMHALPTPVAQETQHYFRWDIPTGRPNDRFVDGPWHRCLIRLMRGGSVNHYQTLINSAQFADHRGIGAREAAMDWAELNLRKLHPEYANAQSIRP